MPNPHNKLLLRFWFASSVNQGVGITAYSRMDAEAIFQETVEKFGLDVEVFEVVENVDISALDPGSVLLNMNPPNFRGVWFPMLNENLKSQTV